MCDARDCHGVACRPAVGSVFRGSRASWSSVPGLRIELLQRWIQPLGFGSLPSQGASPTPCLLELVLTRLLVRGRACARNLRLPSHRGLLLHRAHRVELTGDSRRTTTGPRVLASTSGTAPLLRIDTYVSTGSAASGGTKLGGRSRAVRLACIPACGRLRSQAIEGDEAGFDPLLRGELRCAHPLPGTRERRRRREVLVEEQQVEVGVEIGFGHRVESEVERRTLVPFRG